MKVKSKGAAPLPLKYPILKFIHLITILPFLIVFYVIIPIFFILVLISDIDKTGFLIVLSIMILSVYILPYFNLKRGISEVQVLQRDNKHLIVRDRLFLYKKIRVFEVHSLNIIDVYCWNMLTGNTISIPHKYAKLVINESVTFSHIYKREELEKLVTEFQFEK